mgnify:CR=1 FL=1
MTFKAMLAAPLCAVLGLLAAFSNPVNAQDFPGKQPLKVIVPFPAGGPTDSMARIISERLGSALHQTVVIENRGGGAGGSVGAKAVASADPDGYTILLTPGGPLTSGPAVHNNLGYDPQKVFTPVALLTESPQIICVHPSVPVASALLALAERRPLSGDAFLHAFVLGVDVECRIANAIYASHIHSTKSAPKP